MLLEAIDNIDNQRIEYINCLLKEIGYLNRDAKVKASLLYRDLIGYHEMMRYKEQNKNYLIEVKKKSINLLITKYKKRILAFILKIAPNVVISYASIHLTNSQTRKVRESVLDIPNKSKK